MSLSDLVRLSRTYGADPEWVLAGGGNTSFKDDTTLYIKASGFALATITEEGFARMDRSRLRAIAQATYPTDSTARERRAAADLLAGRLPGEGKRPSVETVMHELLPQRYVIHTHPAIVNGLTCSVDGESAARKVLGDDIVWMPEIEAGYVLAARIGVVVREYESAHSVPPTIILIQNHGLVVGADTPDEVVRLHSAIRNALISAVRLPDLSPVPVDEAVRASWQSAITQTLGAEPSVCFEANTAIARLVADRSSFAPLLGAFTPDHIVYAGPQPLFTSGAPEELPAAVAEHKNASAAVPRIIAVAGLGVFSCGESDKIARTAMTFFLDAVKVALFSNSFGGYRHMSEPMVGFIQNWEVEQYRSKISVGQAEVPHQVAVDE